MPCLIFGVRPISIHGIRLAARLLSFTTRIWAPRKPFLISSSEHAVQDISVVIISFETFGELHPSDISPASLSLVGIVCHPPLRIQSSSDQPFLQCRFIAIKDFAFSAPRTPVIIVVKNTHRLIFSDNGTKTYVNT